MPLGFIGFVKVAKGSARRDLDAFRWILPILNIRYRPMELGMSAKVDKFCDRLRDRLNAIAGRLQSVKTNVAALPDQAV